MINVWSSYKRKQINIDKAVINSQVNQLLAKHYKYLHSILVKSNSDEDTFNDTYLKLTYNYNPDKDFIQQFKYYFYLLKGAYQRDDKVENYYIMTGNVYDIVECISIPDTDTYTEDEQPNKKDKADKQTLMDLKKEIQNYALSTKSHKRATKKD